MLDRKSNVCFMSILVGMILLCLMLFHAAWSQREDMALHHERRELVRVLGVTDLCLVTEARYTRHPSLTDLSTPFQDYPMSFEHFPSGSLMPVPPHLARRDHE